MVQFSGGEPTIHPADHRLREGRERSWDSVRHDQHQWQTHCARRPLPGATERSTSLDLLSIRWLRAETYRIIRSEPGILEEKLRALDRLASIGISVTLVPAIERGVNEHEIGKIIDLAIKHPAVRGINFQPVFHAGRHMRHDPLQRMTIPDVLKLIEQQTAGKFVVSDFIPVPCCFPTCNSVTYAFIDGEQVTPLSRIINVYDYLDYITNRVLPDFSMEIKRALEGLWSSSSVPGSQKSAEQFAVSCQACGIPESFTIGDIAKNVLMIMLQDFMDPWTFNQKNLMKCCKEFLLPGGKQIPFCAYNTVGYREQARAQLQAIEPERRRAKAEGRRFEPRSITFDLGRADALTGLVSIDSRK